jgi:hypothetical protein
MPDSWPDSGANDIRFQFEVIKNLSESVRQIATSMADVQKTQVNMLERLARIESNRINEDVADLRARHDAVNGRVDALERDKDVRDGGSLMRKAIVTWWPVIAATFTAIFLLSRAAGVLHLPTDNDKPPIIVPYRTTEAPSTQPRTDGQ